MNFVIAEVKTCRKQYPDANDPAVQDRLLTLEKYHILARRIIGRFAPANSRMAMLNSDDAIHFVAYHIMLADWGYKKNKSRLNSYRGYCGKRAIQRYLIKLMEQNVIRSRDLNGDVVEKPLLSNSLDSAEEGHNLYDTIADTVNPPPLDKVIRDEETRNNREFLAATMSKLNKTQQKCIAMHFFDDMKMADIARALDITREGVRTAIKNGMKEIRKMRENQHG